MKFRHTKPSFWNENVLQKYYSLLKSSVFQMYFKMRQSVSSYGMYYFKRAVVANHGSPSSSPTARSWIRKGSGRKFTTLAISLIYALRRIYVWKTVEREKKKKINFLYSRSKSRVSVHSVLNWRILTFRIFRIFIRRNKYY